MVSHEGNIPRSVPKYFGGAASASSMASSASLPLEPSVASVVAAMAPLSAPIDDFGDDTEDENGLEQPRPPQRASAVHTNQQQQPRLSAAAAAAAASASSAASQGTAPNRVSVCEQRLSLQETVSQKSCFLQKVHTFGKNDSFLEILQIHFS